MFVKGDGGERRGRGDRLTMVSAESEPVASEAPVTLFEEIDGLSARMTELGFSAVRLAEGTPLRLADMRNGPETNGAERRAQYDEGFEIVDRYNELEPDYGGLLNHMQDVAAEAATEQGQSDTMSAGEGDHPPSEFAEAA